MAALSGVALRFGVRLSQALCAGHRHAGARWDDLRVLLFATRALVERLQLVGAEVVEVIPTAPGSTDATALIADRLVPRS